MKATVTDLSARLVALDDAVAQARGRVPEADVVAAEAVSARAGQRLRLSTAHTVVALAGATGGGKSSLFNALSGLDLARVGVRRPTTAAALACVWGPEGAGPLLEWLGISTRHQIGRRSVLDAGAAGTAAGAHDGIGSLDGLVLLDLPDHDSTEVSHRLEVDRLVQLVDVLVWVVDPQKYADAALHDRYLRALAEHAAVTVVVLNKADQLSADGLRSCVADLERLLVEDGLTGVRVIPTSTATGAGVDALRAEVLAAVARRRAAEQRLAADVTTVAARLLRAADTAAQPAGDSVQRRSALVDALAAAAGVPAVVDAVARSERARAAGVTGWPVTRWLRRFRADPVRRLRLDRGGDVDRVLVRSSLPAATPAQRAQVDEAVRDVVAASTAGQPPTQRAAARAVVRDGIAGLVDALDQAVVSVDLDTGHRSRWWSGAGAVQWVATAASAVGLLWLLVLGVLAWLRVPEPPTPAWGGWPVPTLLLAGGLLGSLVVALLSRWLASVGAARRATRARTALRAAVEEVAEQAVLGPLEREATAWRDLRERALTARG